MGAKPSKEVASFQFPVSRMFALFLILIISISYATDAIAAYRSNTGTSTLSSPKIRYWNSSGTGTWGAEVELPTAGSPIRYLVIKTSPISNKTVLVTLSDDGYLDAYVCNSNCGSAGSWTATNNIGQVWTTAAAQRRFDVDFETVSGDAIVVYSVLNTGTANDLAYKVLPAAATSFTGITEQYIDDTGHAKDLTYTWVDVDCKPGGASDECIMVGFDSTDNDENAWVWNGSAWGNQVSLSDAATATGGYQAQAVKYAADGSKGMAVGGHSTSGLVQYKYWNGTSWSGTASFDIDAADALDLRYIMMKADPATDDIQAFFTDSGSDLGTAYWNGATWTVTSNIDTAVDSATTRTVGFEWNPSGSTGILVWDTDTTGTTISTRVCSPQCTASTVTKSTYAGTGAWMTLFSNPTNSDTVNILGLRLNRNFDIGSFYFDGTNYVNYNDGALTNDTTVSTFEAYDLAFYKPPAPPAATITLNSPANNTNFSSSSITLNWTPANFAGNPTCNVTRNGTLIFTGTCTNGVACTTTNTTSDGLWVWNVTCAYTSTTKVSETRQFRVDTTAPTTSASAVDDLGLPYTFGTPTTSSYVNVTLSCSDSGGIGCSVTQYCTDTTNTCTPNTNYTGVVQISTAGTSYIRFRSNDSVGNLETTQSRTIIIQADAAAPTTTATAVQANGSAYTFDTWTNSSYVNVTLTCDDGGGSGCAVTQYCTDVTNSCTPSLTYSAPVQISTVGTSYIRFRSNDSVGNLETTNNKTIRIDLTAPTTTATAVQANGTPYTFNTWTNSTYVNVTLTCNDGTGSGCNITQYCTDATNTCTPSTAYSVPVQISAEGTTYIRYRANDSAGNLEAVKNQTVKIDRTAPALDYTAASIANNIYTNSTSAYIEISYSEANPDTCTLAFNGTNYSMTRNSTHCYINKATFTDGYYIYNVTLNDSLGNSNTTATRNMTLDRTAPQIAYTANNEPDNAFLNRSWAYFEITYTETNPQNCTLFLNGTQYAMNRNSTNCYYNATGLTDGYYLYNITMNDSAGNLNRTETRNLSIDSSLPQINYTDASTADNAYINTNTAYFEAAYSESNPSACTLAFNGTNSTMVMNATHCYINKLIFSDGYYEYNITLNDTSGNSNTTQTRNITRDTAAPAIAINSPANDSYFQFNNVVVNYTVSDANLNFTNISIYNSTGELLNSTLDLNSSSGTRTISLYVAAGDGYNITATAYDLAGNSNSSTSQNVSVATSVPVTTATGVKADGSPYSFGTKTNSAYVNVTLSCSAALGCDTTLYCLDSANSCAPTIAYSGTIQISTQGTSYIRYWSNDSVGTQEETKNKTIIIFTGNLVSACSAINDIGTMNYLDTDLVAAENESCLAINADNITLDCEGHSISGSGSPLANTYGILADGRLNITVKNCNVSGFASGINLYYTNESAVMNVSVSSNVNGVLLQSAYLNTISSSTGTGNGVAFYLQDSSNNTLDSLTAFGNGYGIYIFGDSTSNVLTNISSYGNDYD